MKTKITLLFLFIAFVAKASYDPGTIVFKDGHTETGFIYSAFSWNLNPFSSNLEKGIGLDDMTVKFKTSMKGDVRKLSIDEIDEMRFTGENISYPIWKPFPLKTINKKGEFEDMEMKVWLPLLKKGKINLYGFSYIEKTGGIPFTNFSFYFSKEGEDFAICPYRKISNEKNQEIILKSLFNYLFKDCEKVYNTRVPEILKELNPDKTKEERKIAREKYNNRVKGYQRESLDLMYQFNFINDTTAELLSASEKECK